MKENESKHKLYQELPRIDALVAALPYAPWITKRIANEVLTTWREGIATDQVTSVNAANIQEEIRGRIEQIVAPQMKPLVNATGVLLHTNIGRAPLAEAALAHASRIASDYCNLELDATFSERGERMDLIEDKLRLITGKEAALCVNNNAAALFFVLQVLGKSKEIIVSKGEQIEIGGSFRIPEIAKETHATIIEVGTTNVTRRRDYERAVTDNTAMLLRVEPSNFTVLGQTERVSDLELVDLCQDHGLIYYLDLGSGALKDFPFYDSIHHLPDADLLSFSGDKLVGSAQAGIIVGRQALIDRLKCSPLYRTYRLDKVNLAILDYSLSQYFMKEPDIPIIQLIAEDTKAKATALATLTGLPVVSCEAFIGGGVTAGTPVASHGVRITQQPERTRELLKAKGVLGRIEQGALVLDVYAIRMERIHALAEVINEAIMHSGTC